MPLPQDAVLPLREAACGPALGVRDDYRLLDEDCDAEGMDVSRADVEVSVDVSLDDGRGVVVAPEELAGVRHASVRIADPHDVALPLEPFLDLREPVAALRRGHEADPPPGQALPRIVEVPRGSRRAGESRTEDPR